MKERDTKSSKCGTAMQMMDVGVEGSAPDMLVKVLSHVTPLGFIQSKGQTAAGLEATNPRLMLS